MSGQFLSRSGAKAKHPIAGRKSHPIAAPSFHATRHPILQLQRSIGNRRVAQLVQAKLLGRPARQAGNVRGDQAVHRVIQAKLEMSQPGDIYEQEADQAARQVMLMLDDAVIGAAPSGQSAARVQRMCAECAEESLERSAADNEEKKVNRRSADLRTVKLSRLEQQSGGAATTSPAVEAQIEGLRGGGESLSEPLRRFFEPRFGFDFGRVRVHTDTQAAESARAINAHAFTIGSDVVFAAGQYAPDTSVGRGLIAHELAHVIQQTGGRANGDWAQSKPVEQDPATPLVQGRWRLDSIRPFSGIDAQTLEGHASAIVSINNDASQLSSDVYAGAFSHQEQGFVHQKEGGAAQVADWAVKHYVFKNDGADDDLLELHAVGQLGGDAKAEDLRYARGGAVVWGSVIERTQADPTPPDQRLFVIEDGGISAATVGSLGEIEADIPFGERGNINIKIPLKKVDEGEFVPFSDSTVNLHTVPSTVAEVDVLLGARVEADADIETAFTGLSPLISTNHNDAQVNGRFKLIWNSRPAPSGAADVQPLARKWGCTHVKCDLVCGRNTSHIYADSDYIYSTHGEACNAAKRAADKQVPRDCYKRHCDCDAPGNAKCSRR